MTFKLSDFVIGVEDVTSPRPHDRVTMKAVTRGHPDLLPGLVQDGLTMTVALPVSIGTDLSIIKQAAARRFASIAAEIVDGQLPQQGQGAETFSPRGTNGPTSSERHHGNGRSHESRRPNAAENGADGSR
jgi:hypothetical protein